MNTYIVWTSDTSADRFQADLIISMLDEIQFFLSGRLIKRYQQEFFKRYNPNWVQMENPE
jgi:hypothetical protein